MKQVTSLVIAGLVLMLHVPLSWGGPPNPTGSDARGNTAGGDSALDLVTTGSDNTAFGYWALAGSDPGSSL